LPAELLRAPSSSYLRDLPIIFQDSDFLGRMLLIFENIWEPLELRQDHIERYFDPRTCPAVLLPWLASWVDLPLSPHWPEARVRQLVAEALDLYRWRGTRYGLARMIEIRTGLSARIDEVPDQPWVFRVTIQTPDGAGVDRALVEEVIDAHKPAHAGYILEVNG
jgi:phage tail-like protein